MKVMLIESVPSADVEVAEELRSRGHDVVRCYAEDDAPFPCVGITAPERCPLATGDVAVACVVREFGVFDPTPFEAGVTCALRSRVPVVVDDANISPFGGYVIDARGDLVGAAERAAAGPLEGHAEALRSFLAESVPECEIDVRRVGGELKVWVTLPAGTAPAVEKYVTSRAAGVIRSYDPYVPCIDVAVRVAVSRS